MYSALFEAHAKHRLVTNAVQKIVFSNLVGSLQKKLRAGQPNFRLVNL